MQTRWTVPTDGMRPSAYKRTNSKQRSQAEPEQGQQAKVDGDARRAGSPRSNFRGSPRSEFPSLRSPPRSPLIDAAERFRELYSSPAQSVSGSLVTQAMSNGSNRQEMSAQRALQKPQRVESEQLQSGSSLSDLHESMKSLHAELSQVSLSIRSVIRSELSESMKAFQKEQSQMRKEESQTNYTMRSIIRSELKEFMKDNQMSQSTRSVIHDELEDFMQHFTSLPPTRPLPLRDLSASGARVAEEKASQCQRSTQAVPPLALPALEEPLLDGSACKEAKEGERVSDHTRRSSSSSAKRHLLKVDGQAQKDSVKKTLEAALTDDDYNVEDLYLETGMWQALARQTSWFSKFSLAVVGANVLWIGIDEDLNQEDVLCKAPILSQVVNNIFCTFFTFEIVVNFLAFKQKTNAFKNGNFWFDLILAFFMVWETWIEVFLYLVCGFRDTSGSALTTQVFRFVRLFRLSRAPRIVRLSLAVPELIIMMRGMIAAMRSVMVILVFLFFTIYVFGILFTELLRDVEPFTTEFANVGESMYTLLLQVLCGVDAEFLNSLFAANVAYYILYLAFLFLAIFTLMNMLIGVLCDVVADVRDTEVANMHAAQLEHDITMISELIDKDKSGSISESEFKQIMNTKEVLKSLNGMGVDVVALAGLQEVIFKDDEELTLSEFCQMIAQFRGSRVATVKDLLDTHKFISVELDTLTSEVKRIVETSQYQPVLSNTYSY